MAFIEGHGELSLDETYDITLALQEDYNVERFRIDESINALVNRNLIDYYLSVSDLA